MDDTTAQPMISYQDDDLVYVDPDARVVVGKVEWNTAGRPKSLPMKMEVEEEEDSAPPTPADASSGLRRAGEKGGKEKRRIRRQRYYPWGTYRSMKRIYKLEGKQPKQESQKTLDEVLEKALKEPFWD